MQLRNLFGVVLLSLALALSAQADSPECLISFDSARLDVCSGDWQLVNDDLRHLADVSAFDDTAYRVVKFDRPVGRSDREALAALGVEVLGYVPHYAYKVRMRPSMDATVADLDDVAWVGPFLPVWKVGINLANDLQLGNVRRDAPDVDMLTITLHQGAGTGRVENDLLAIQGLDLVNSGSSAVDEYLIMQFEADHLESIVEHLAANEHVAAIKFRFPNQLLNSQGVWLHQSGEHDPPQTPLFDQGLFGCGQVIGMLDSGMDVNHCSFDDPDPSNDFPYTACTDGVDCPVIGATDEHRKVGAFYHWEDGASSPGDSHGHGTAVAGNALGSNWNDPVDCDALSTPGNMEDVDGMAPGARAIVQAAGGGLDYLNTHGGNVYHAATTAFANGAYIHNNSWGSGCRGIFGCVADCIVEYRENSRYGDMAAWENPELLIFAAAGNSGGGDGAPGCGLGADVGSPANAKGVFAIGGTQRGELGDDTYMNSSRGPASDRRTKPDILAQSQAVMTSSVGSGCGVSSATGTSFGSPTAAGFGALVREYLQRGFYPLGFEVEANAIPDPSAAVIRAIMTNSSVQIFGQGSGTDFPNQNLGWGRLLADNALYFDGDDRLLWIHDEKDGLETDETDVHQITVGDGQELIVTLIWHDYFAELNADPHIVNQLRLEVETPSGDVWSQKLTPGGGLADPNPFQDTTDTDYDDRNTVHQIMLDAPENGTYEIRVTGIQVAMGDAQPYALAVTGDLLGIGDPDFILTRTPSQISVCEGDDAVYDIGVLSISEFEDDVTLSVSDGLPTGASADFSINPVTPTDPATVSELTISGTAAVAAGSYTLEITGQSNGPEFDPITKSITAGLTVDEPLGGPALIAPPDGITDITLQPDFEWGAVAGAVNYTLQVATDPGFNDLVIDVTVEGETYTPGFELDTGTTHYWRVQAHNACGDGDWSDVFDFQTRFEPVAEVGPESFSFELILGETDSDTLSISNIGTGNLVWNIDTDEPGDANLPMFGGHFDIENWELVNDPSGVGGSFDTEPGPPLEVYITGGDAGTGGNTDLQIEIPMDGVIIFDWGYQTSDTACWDSGGYAINGVYTELACNDSPVPYFDETEVVEVSAGDIFAFRMFTQDGQFGPGVLGVTNFQFQPAVCDDPSGVPWLSVDPASGSTPAGDTDEVTVTVDSNGLNEDVFEGYLCISTNAQDAPMIPVPVELTVFDPDSGAVAGNVTGLGYCSDDPSAAAGATVSVEGDSGAVFTTTTDGDGNFSININEDESPVDITVSLAGHLDAVETGVTVTAGQTTNVDFELFLDAPCASVTPEVFNVTVTAGEIEGFDLFIGNEDGAGELEWDVAIAESSCASTNGVGWLSVDPDSGTAAGGATDTAVLTVDTDGLADGDYEALVCVGTSDGQADAFEVPFNLQVIDPSLAVFEGVVSSVGLCGEDPGPLADATIVIEGVSNTFETQTDGNGFYQIQVSEDESPADVSVSAEHHAGQTETGVTFEGGDTVTLDFELEADAACASVTPEAISESADLGDTAQATIEIENTGNLSLDWALGFVDGSATAAWHDAAVAEAAAVAGAGREVVATSPEDEALGIEREPYQSITAGESLFTAAQRRQIIEGGVVLMPDSSSPRRITAYDPQTGDVIDLNFFHIEDNAAIPIQVILHPDGERFLLTRQSGATGGIVEAYDMDGEYLGVFAPQGGQDESIMQNIRGLAVHPATGNILVAVSGTNNTDPDNRDSVLEFDQDGAWLGHFIESGEGGLNGPWSMVFRSDDVIVADSGSDILRRFTWDGEFIEVFTDDPNFPQQIHQNADGHILAAGFSNPSGAWEWDADGEEIGLYGPETGLRGIYDLPGGTIMVTNGGGVHEIDRDGNLVRTITADVTGRFLSLIQPALQCDPQPPGWLSVDPGSGSTDPGSTDSVDVTMDTAGLSPGEYTAQICVESNDPVNPVIPVDVTFTVELGSNFSVIEGEVFSLGFCGEDGFPAAGADIEVVGQTETWNTTANADGFYQIQVPVDEGPFDITASAPDHFPQTETDVTAPGGGSVTVDFDLEAETSCIDVDPTELSATLDVGQSEDLTFDISNVGTSTLNWMIDVGSRTVRDESAPLIGFNFTTSGSATSDPQGWTRIGDASGSLVGVPDDTGESTDVGISWGGVTTDGFLFLSTSTLAGDAVPQHHYDLSGMTGYGFRSGGDFFIEVDGLQPNAAYEYWFVAYRGASNIDNIVKVSDGDEIDAFEFNQFLASGDNDGHFVINELRSSDEQVWDELSFITHASSDGTITIHWEGDTQTTVIGAFAIRSALTCDIPEWLSVAPTSGSIDVGAGSDTVTATLDATGLEPGEYSASICVESDDPVNPVVPVDVSLVVEFGEDFGFLDGQVNSLGYCSDNPFAAEGATLEIVGQTETFTTTTDENGEYSIAIPIDESPVDITASAPGHLPMTMENVDLVGGDVVTVDFDLTLDAPCATVTPDSFAFTVGFGGSGSDELEIGNVDGAADLEWTVFTSEIEAIDPRAHFPEVPYAFEPVENADVSELADVGATQGQVTDGVWPLDADVPVYSTTGWDAPGYITMDALVPGEYTIIEPDQPTSVFAATFIANDFTTHYGLATSGGDLPQDTFIAIDTETGDYEVLGTVSGGPGGTWTSMKWDHTTSTLFASTVDELYTIDPDSLEATLVGPIDPAGTVISIAISPEGLMYGIDITNNVLLAIDKTSGDASAIGALGFNPNFAQDMDFDHSDGTLYWGGYFGGGDSQIMVIDTDTGAATSLGNVQGGTELLSFSIAIPGAGDCTEAADIDWLSVTPEAGTTAAGSTDSVTVAVNASGLSAGMHEANVCVGSNDPEQGLHVVPVTLEVLDQDPPVIDVDPTSLGAQVGEGESAVEQFTIGNLGEADLNWLIEDQASGCELPGWASADPVAGTVAEGDSQDVMVTFDATGLEAGVYEATLCVDSNDPDTPRVEVDLTLTVTDDLATVEGIVMSLGYCQDDPGAAAGALVVVQGQQSSYSTVTDAGGFYQIAVPADESPVSVMVSLTGHRTTSIDDVELSEGETVEVDADLVLRQACAQITPEAFAFSVPVDGQDGDVLVVSNALGGADLGWWLEAGEGCHDPAGNSWLTLSQNSATVARGNTREFGVMVDASDLEVGEYATTLCIGTDDPDAASFAIPVELEVSTDDPVIFQDRFEADDNG
jgi:hypothetical protein